MRVIVYWYLIEVQVHIKENNYSDKICNYCNNT